VSEWQERRLSYRQKILNRAVGVEEGGAHGPVDVSPCETHALHVCNGGLALSTHSQSRGVIEAFAGRLGRCWRWCSRGVLCAG
jgi:hypothetical protein